MSKDVKTVQEMIDYVRQLRRHTEDRRAIHVKLSRLEKHFREEHYRRFAASALRPLITNNGATMFALPNADLVLMVQGARVDSIDTLLNHVRRKYRDAALLQNLDPVQGQSDAFVEWFELEEDYVGFRKYIEALGQSLMGNAETEAATSAGTQPDGKKTTPGRLEILARETQRLAPSKKVKMVPIDAPVREEENRDIDPELLVQMVKAVRNADVGGMLRKQRVLAVLAGGQRQPVMIHKFVPRDVVFERLLNAPVSGENVWLDGYISDLLASRILFAAPNMANENSIASSIRATIKSIFDGSFDEFDQSLGAQPKSAVIVEFSAPDVLANFDLYKKAHAKLESAGFRLMISEVEIPALLWLNYASFEADFVKLRAPHLPEGEWLSADLESHLKRQIKNIGQARVILNECEKAEDVALGQRLGITLFQGAAVEPYGA
jgi:hypothetical protein